MMLDLTVLLDQYIEALQTFLTTTSGVDDRNSCFERLAAADAMRSEIKNANFGRVAGILNEEKRVLGWQGFHGKGSDAVHQSFYNFTEALQSARLADKPDAGFGH